MREHFVYKIWDRDERVIYVGHTMRPESRWKAHRVTVPDLYAKAVGCKMYGPHEKPTALRREAHLIHVFQPHFNQAHTGYLRCPCGCGLPR